MAFKVTYFHGSQEVSEDEWTQTRIRTRRKLKLGRKSPNTTRKDDCIRAGACAATHSVMDAHDERHRKLYREEPPPVIDDYRCEAAKKTWPRYARVQTRDGQWHEGPLRFRSYEEQHSYEKAFGFHQYTGGGKDR